MSARRLLLSAQAIAIAITCAQPRSLLAEDLPLGLTELNPGSDTPPAAEVSLGKKLFFDKSLSADGSISCATCHVPEEAFAQRDKRVSEGIDGRLGRRNSPSLLNVRFAKHLFLDGRSDSLEDQAWRPILDKDEMGNGSVDEVLKKLAASEEYPALFGKTFGVERPDKKSVAKALASFQRTLLTGNSPFDQWFWGGEDDAISKQAIEGYNLFAGQALCWQCHNLGGDHGVILTDHLFHNTGVAWLSEQKRKKEKKPDAKTGHKEDLGRFEATGLERDKRQYKTPSLRNVALTPPYMHDGSFASLEEVVEFYNRGGGDGATQPLYLEKDQVKNIVAFLETLTGDQEFEE